MHALYFLPTVGMTFPPSQPSYRKRRETITLAVLWNRYPKLGQTVSKAWVGEGLLSVSLMIPSQLPVWLRQNRHPGRNCPHTQGEDWLCWIRVNKSEASLCSKWSIETSVVSCSSATNFLYRLGGVTCLFGALSSKTRTVVTGVRNPLRTIGLL